MEKKELLRDLSRQSEAISRRKNELINGLPHLYGWKWYAWARAFFNSTNKMNLLCAANQISKSSTQIRKCIDWGTNVKKWSTLWPNRKPKIFWYLYPSNEVATVEWDKKWVPEFLPKASFKTHPVYGWREERGEKKVISAVHFFSGVSIYFKTYSQAAINLQTATVDAIFCDEELPEELYSELIGRLFGTDGYFHMVFTATLNQEVWYRAMESTGAEEMFPDAFKLQVSMYDCMVYDDGSPGPWTLERIKEKEALCKSDAERQRRIYGKFISESGRKYHTFNPAKHYVKPFPIPQDWVKLCAVDLGSGMQNHPAAIAFLAVRPDMKYGVIHKAWRGDHTETTDGDVYNKFLALRQGQLLHYQIYDAAGKDFGTIATRAGDSFIKAEKSHEVGESIVNTLFQNDMLQLFDDDDEVRKLGVELTLLLKSTPKQKAKDDLCFDGRTLVVTARGAVAIKKVRVGDFVLTRFGFRKVVRTLNRRADMNLYEMTSTFLKATSNHRIFAADGFKPLHSVLQADSLRYLSYREFFKCLRVKLSSSMALSLGATQPRLGVTCETTTGHQPTTATKALAPYIRKCGRRILVLYRQSTLFTIKTKILLTTMWITSNVYLKLSMRRSIAWSDWQTRCIGRKIVSILPKLITLPKLGTPPKRDDFGIAKMLKHSAGLGNLGTSFANFVSLLLVQPVFNRLSFALENVSLHTGGLPVSTPLLEPVHAAGLFRSIGMKRKSSAHQDALRFFPLGKSDVYNLTIEEHHEYFAEGILVANCDTLRYNCCQIPWDFTHIKAKTEEAQSDESRPLTAAELKAEEIRRRRGETPDPRTDNTWAETQAEFDYWNSQYGS